MEKIDYNDITQLNIELFREKLYFRLSPRETAPATESWKKPVKRSGITL